MCARMLLQMSIAYVPGGMMPKLQRYLGKIIEVRIPAKYLTVKNREVSSKQLWGTDVYTDDSDAVASKCAALGNTNNCLNMSRNEPVGVCVHASCLCRSLCTTRFVSAQFCVTLVK